MSRTRAVIEYLLLFFGVVGVCIAVHVPGGPIPVLLVAAVAAFFYLRRADGFDRRTFLRPEALRPALPSVIRLWLAVSTGALVVVAIVDRGHLFDLPRQQPLLWLAVLIFYPLASVYPQELIYRAFLMHRYSPAFGRTVAPAGALAFGYAHLLFGNLIAVVATLAGGWLFARRYRQTRSLLVVSVEHALYGATIFTIGLGRFFYHAGHF
ncbi:CPBP family intramembrane glutamic endopeptidase [Actinoplanes sp. NPDC051411]|uniref:CPBP family intramembrane glutamic endopeptidase n=1 Tax=Actinoplanes sp. NPDC051411 TaxID=3155522 RepID=UPI003447E2C2